MSYNAVKAPYGSHVTCADASWSGVPTVTVLNDVKLPSRVAGSFLTSLNVTELITTSWKEYEDLAVRLATDEELNLYNSMMECLPLSYTNVKQKLIQNRKITPAFDTQLYVKNLEVAYKKMAKVSYKICIVANYRRSTNTDRSLEIYTLRRRLKETKPRIQRMNCKNCVVRDYIATGLMFNYSRGRKLEKNARSR
jgi:hypothetical protein